MFSKLPNDLTLIRIMSVPVISLFVLFFYNGFFSRGLACIIFICLALTDYFDGYFARKFNSQSAFGKCFDNIADKLLVTSLLVVLVSQKRADIIPVLIIIFREIFVSGLREFFGQKSIVLSVSKIAKYKTTFQLLAIGFMILGAKDSNILNFGIALLWISAIITIITMYDYTKKAITSL